MGLVDVSPRIFNFQNSQTLKLLVGRRPVLSQMQHEPEESFTSCTAAQEEQATEWASAVDRRIAFGPEPTASYYVPVG